MSREKWREYRQAVRDEDSRLRGRIHKAARLRSRPGTEGERVAAWNAVTRLVKRLHSLSLTSFKPETLPQRGLI